MKITVYTGSELHIYVDDKCRLLKYELNTESKAPS